MKAKREQSMELGQNEQGLTLIEMLIAILIFILATVFIVSLVSNALDKPKEAGVRAAMSSYESAAQILMIETSGKIANGINKETLATHAELVKEFNTDLDPASYFVEDKEGSKTENLKNAYGNEYEITITKVANEPRSSIVITSEGKKGEVYTLAVYYDNGVVSIGTKGFGRNDKPVDNIGDLTANGEIGEPIKSTTAT